MQAYDLAVRIAPQDERALAGQARARELASTQGPPAASAAPPAAGTAPSRRRSLRRKPPPPHPPPAADAAFGEDRYAKAAGEGFAALGAGRLDEARAAFERARAARPDGAEATDGLKRVEAATHARGFGTLRTRAEDAEADERWDDALAAYTSILRRIPRQEFAQEGRTAARRAWR